MSADPKVVPLQKAPDLTPGDVAISEDRLALRFVEVHGQRYRYVPGWGRVDWTGTRWRRDVSLQLQRQKPTPTRWTAWVCG